MIKLMLRQSVEHVSEVVMRAVLPRNRLRKALLREVRYRGGQLIMYAPHLLKRPAPGRITSVANRRKILSIRKFNGHAGHPPPHCPIPGRNMQHQFPDAVRILDRSSSRLRRGNSSQNFKQRIPMPGAPIERPSQLIGNMSSFRHSSSPADILLNQKLKYEMSDDHSAIKQIPASSTAR